MQQAPLERELGKGLWTTIRLLPVVSRPRTAGIAALLVVSAVLPVAFIVASGLLVGRVPAAVADGLDGPGGRALIRALAVVAGLFLAQQVVGIVINHLADVLGRKLNGHLRDRVVAASLDPAGIEHLETPAVVDTMMLARNVAPGFFTPGSAVFGIVAGVGDRLVALGSVGIVATYSVPLALLLLASTVAAQTLLLKALFRSARMLSGPSAGAPAMRRAVYFRDLALTPGASKEIRVFGLGGWLQGRHSMSWLDSIAAAWAERRGSQRTFLWSNAISAVGLGVGLATVVMAAADGQIDLGRFAVLLGAVMGTQSFRGDDNDLRAAYGASAVPALLDLERQVRDIDGRRRAAATPEPARSADLAGDQPKEAIAFEGVHFTYPGSSTPIFEGLDLRVDAGTSLAVVGVNGAGKTTLVKLLCGLYAPTAGRITVDGVDLAELDPSAWRRRVAVLFQDFLRYELSARDNVGFGALGAEDARLARAVDRAGAADLVDGLPNGWDTVLSRSRTGGVDLSGGQWQRVALARALLATDAGARVLVLDEPTANLDVRAESEIYDRFLDLTEGLTSIVISHRFSTVRRADRIVVIEDGRVIEDGSHDTLLRLGGRYATMFRVQADRFVAPLEGAADA